MFSSGILLTMTSQTNKCCNLSAEKFLTIHSSSKLRPWLFARPAKSFQRKEFCDFTGLSSNWGETTTGSNLSQHRSRPPSLSLGRLPPYCRSPPPPSPPPPPPPPCPLLSPPPPPLIPPSLGTGTTGGSLLSREEERPLAWDPNTNRIMN